MFRSMLAASTALAAVLGATTAFAGGQPDAGQAEEVWVDPAHVHLGDAVTGTLVEGDSRTPDSGLMDRFTIDLQAGTRVDITMRSSVFDAYLVGGFLGADGFEEIAVDDDGLGEGLDSRLRFTAAEAGRYEIRARGFAGTGAGEYVLSFGERAADVAVVAPGSLASGGAVDGYLSADDPAFDWADGFTYDAYRFSARAGDRLEATLRSTDFDTTLMLIQESRWGVVEQLAFDDDGLGEGTNSRLRFFVPEDGDYSLRVSSFGPGETGAYSLALTALAPPPPPSVLMAGQTQTGAIGSSDPQADDGQPYDAYTFHASAGERLEIRAASDSFSPTLELGRVAGVSGWEVSAFGDNYDGASPETRLLFSPEEAGDYVVRISGAGTTIRGDYEISLRDRGPLPPAPPAGSIRVGDSVSGTLAAGDGESAEDKYFDEYDIRTTQGQRLSVAVSSSDYDSYVEVYRQQPDGSLTLEASDDDSGGELNSLAVLRTEAGTYRIRVTSFAGGEEGAYALTVLDLGPWGRPSPLRLGRSVTGQIDAGDPLTDAATHYDTYGFRLEEGARAQFIARSDAFDTFLIAARRNGEEFEMVGYDDDGLGDGTTNSRLTVVADQSGEYELWVLPLDPGTSGAYTLESADIGPSPVAQPIAVGATITGELRATDGVAAEGMNYDAFNFQGTAGQRIRFDMASPTFDTFLIAGIHGADGLAAIGENDDSNDGTNSSLTLTLPSDALYEVWASSYAIGETGDYTLTMTDLGPEPEPGSLLIGSTIRGGLSDQDPTGPDGAYFDAYRFTALAGQPVRITATSNAFDAYLELGRMEGRTFTIEQEDDDGLSDLNSLITFTPETTETYVLRVRSYSAGETGDYVLTVEDAPAE